jgi:hypothetical protein
MTSGMKYRVHQTQYYNSNFQDARNPRVTELTLTQLGDDRHKLGREIPE